MAKREFDTEHSIRNFKSKVLLLPKKLLFQINQIIEDGGKEWKVEGFIKQNYHGIISPPTPPTISVYIDWYQAKKKFQQEKGIVDTPTSTELAILEKQDMQSIEEEHKTILDTSTKVDDKKQLLELLIKKCIQRIKKVESLQDVEGMTASLEAVIGSYLREIHSITTTQLKLSGELHAEQNEIISKMINNNLYTLITLMFSAINAVAPELTDAIRGKFFEKIKENKDLQQIIPTTVIK